MRSILPALSACLLMACAATPAWPDAAESAALEEARNQAELTSELSSKLWEWAEVGYQEEKSSALLQQTLADEGFTVTPGVAGIPTAFMAEYGSDGPVIALLAEMDALPGINQAASPDREEVDGKGARRRGGLWQGLHGPRGPLQRCRHCHALASWRPELSGSQHVACQPVGEIPLLRDFRSRRWRAGAGAFRA